MRFYQEQHRHTCGIGLHGRNLYLCVLDEQGDIRLHRKLRCDPELFLRPLRPHGSLPKIGRCTIKSQEDGPPAPGRRHGFIGRLPETPTWLEEPE